MATFSELMTDLADEVRRITPGYSISGEKMSIAEMTSILSGMGFVKEAQAGTVTPQGDIIVEISGYDATLDSLLLNLSAIDSSDTLTRILSLAPGESIRVIGKDIPLEERQGARTIQDGSIYAYDESFGAINQIEIIAFNNINLSGGVCYVRWEPNANHCRCLYISSGGIYPTFGEDAYNLINLDTTNHQIIFQEGSNITFNDVNYEVVVKGTST